MDGFINGFINGSGVLAGTPGPLPSAGARSLQFPLLPLEGARRPPAERHRGGARGDPGIWDRDWNLGFGIGIEIWDRDLGFGLGIGVWERPLLPVSSCPYIGLRPPTSPGETPGIWDLRLGFGGQRPLQPGELLPAVPSGLRPLRTPGQPPEHPPAQGMLWGHCSPSAPVLRGLTQLNREKKKKIIKAAGRTRRGMLREPRNPGGGMPTPALPSRIFGSFFPPKKAPARRACNRSLFLSSRIWCLNYFHQTSYFLDIFSF